MTLFQQIAYPISDCCVYLDKIFVTLIECKEKLYVCKIKFRYITQYAVINGTHTYCIL